MADASAMPGEVPFESEGLPVFLSWEALTALATILSAVVVAVTIVIAIRQLRLTREQVDHLRRATQLSGTMALFEELDRPEFRVARRFVTTDLGERMRDPVYRAEAARLDQTDEAVHRELIVLMAFEKLGTYVKHGMVDGDIVYDYAAAFIILSWEALVGAQVVMLHRAAYGDAMWENFEELYDRCRAWVDGIRDRSSPLRFQFAPGARARPAPSMRE